jgi:hypothetical protein
MSMMCGLIGLSSAQIAAVRAQPQLANDIARVAQDDEMRARLNDAMSRMPPERRAASEAQMRDLLAKPEVLQGAGADYRGAHPACRIRARPEAIASGRGLLG